MKFCILVIFEKSLIRIFFVLLVNYLTRFILRQAIWSNISQMIGIQPQKCWNCQSLRDRLKWWYF